MTGQTTPRRQTDHRLPDHAARAHRYTAAAARALLAGHSPAALRLLDAARSRPAPASVRGGGVAVGARGMVRQPVVRLPSRSRLSGHSIDVTHA